jgi:3-carboxy-cis,cis-muconate cycloisomerase
VRPSSSSSEGLFSGVLARGEAAVAVGDAGWLRALLDVEAALAHATAAVGLVPAAAAETIARVCGDASAYDVDELGRQAAAGGNPVIPLVRAIERAAGDAGRHVHHGATSQDILDTAMMLVASRALGALTADLRAAQRSAVRLARQHRDDVMAGRTLLQQALPTTFGLKAAGWALALDGARERVTAVSLPVQLGGAAGTLSAYGGQGSAVTQRLAALLDLSAPVLPWHTSRLPVADLAGALGSTAGVVGKVALDVVLLAQTEVAEVAEGGQGRGGSSAMPHKRNPVAAVQARAATRRAPGLVATLLAQMEQEHERAAGAWHAEWAPLTDLILTTGSAVAWLWDCLRELRVDAPRMRDNLESAAGDVATERIASALAPVLGRAAAHELVAAAAHSARSDQRLLRDVLLADKRVTSALGTEGLDELLDGPLDIGEAPDLVDAALAALDEKEMS